MGLSRDVADFPAIPGNARQRASVDDEAAADTDFARDEQHIALAHRCASPQLGEGPQVSLVGDRHRWARCHGLRDASAQGYVAPPQVGRHAHEFVATANDFDHCHPDADERMWLRQPSANDLGQLGQVFDGLVEGDAATRAVPLGPRR